MPCKEANVFFLLEGELSGAEAAMVRKHCKDCAVCRTLYLELHPFAKALHATSSDDMRPHEILAVRQRILQGGPISEKTKLSLARPSRRRSDRQPATARIWLLVPLLIFAIVAAFVAGMWIPGSIRARQVSPAAAKPIIISQLSAPRPPVVSEKPPDDAEPAVVAIATPEPLPITEGSDWQQSYVEQNGTELRTVRDIRLKSGTRIIWRFEGIRE